MNIKTHTAIATLTALLAQAAFAADGGIRTGKAESFEIPDSAGIKMVRIEAGTFTMGSPKGEVARADDEVRHEVTIAKPFYMAETEITQDQYLPVMVPDYKSDAVRLRYMRSASRNRFPMHRPYSILGFRPVLAPEVKAGT